MKQEAHASKQSEGWSSSRKNDLDVMISTPLKVKSILHLIIGRR
ncbi:hypothetical protein MM817_00633 [Acidibacillus sp. S0AB]|uniref:Uncharacterized protein n=1 Tax=Sulfoacidibacillus ferrooxidans TaxID=2005001 RepID=A0A9X1V7E5_9BACL|nr:hypothetical protein [Sulfoacidibacillus ferrooxidans]